jgi:predicted nucleotidyltransferase
MLYRKEAVLIKAAGVVVEYNPFHNGHAYHLQETKKITEADVVIAVMSGSFLQRGEPALVSKWARTRMALEGGVDIVAELPYAFSTQKAKTFASGAISILEAFGVEEICFGSENGSIEPFLSAVQLQQNLGHELDEAIQKHVKKGISYPRALSEAFARISKGETLDLAKPNNILGFHYVEAIVQQKSRIIPKTIQRLSSQYHDETFATASIASATSIRKHIQSHSLDTASGVMPYSTLHHLRQYYRTYSLFHDWEQYFSLLKYKLLTMSPKDLKQIYEAEEGLEHRLLSAVKEASSFNAFMEAIKTKRYTWTRLQRLCLHVLTHTTKEQMSYMPQNETAPYIRLLGMSIKGQKYISEKKKDISLPLLSNIKSFNHPLLNIDHKANAVYLSVLSEPLRSAALKADFVQHPLRYDEEQKVFL